MGRPRKKRGRATSARPAEATAPGPPWYRRIPTAVQWASGVVGLMSATLGLVFLLFPGARPDPDPPPAAGSLELTVEDPVTYRQYLLLENIDPSTSSPATLERRGALIKVSAEIAGYRGRRLPMRWLLIDTESGEPTREDDRRTFKPDRDGPFTERIFVEVPQAGRYKVRVQLYPPEAEQEQGIKPLVDEDSEIFAWSG